MQIMNKKTTLLQVGLNGQQVWVTASTEQEYAEHVALLLTGGSNQASVKKGHDFKVYAEKWFEVFSKPNVEKVTAITYERQLNNHLIPTFSGMTLEEITTADVQAMQDAFAALEKLTDQSAALTAEIRKKMIKLSEI